MIVKHSLMVAATCPVDASVLDIYEVDVETDRVLPVEDILEARDRLTLEPIYQEDLTVRLAAALGARVTTRGIHSGVATVCEADPA